MNLIFGSKKPPVIKVIIYIILGLLFAFLANVQTTVMFSPIIAFLTMSFFALSTYHIGLLTLIPTVVVLAALGMTSDFLSAASFAPVALTSLTLGFSLRSSSKPSEKIILSSVTYVLSTVLVFIISIYANTGNLDISAAFTAFGDNVEEVILALSNEIQKKSGIILTNIGSLIDFIKSIMIGTYLAFAVGGACFAYCLAIIISKASGNIDFSGKPLDIRPSTISSVLFLICLVITLFTNIPSSGFKFYSTLAINLLLTITPLFFASGIYYFFKIKFKVEHGNPLWLIIVLAVSVFYGAYFVGLLYIAMCGALYSIKYNKFENSKGTLNDSKH